ncbi:MAG: hypothetical protein OEZ38_05805 [Gammaproteobacteria bacterium]|nr:hypothetical protein [Gammaproteobacteria bacterium]
MNKPNKNNQLTTSNIIAAILFALLLIGLILFATYYNPDDQYSSSFFDNISDFMK